MARNKICIEEIRLAVKGDSLAMQKMVHHFRPYIKKFSLVIMQTDSDNTHFLDDEKVQIIEAHLMEAILKFDAARVDRRFEATIAEFMMDTDTGFA